MSKPRIALTLGDPLGIGPETVVRAWGDAAVHDCCRPLVVGNAEFVRRAIKLLAASAAVVEVDAPENADPSPQRIPVLQCGSDDVLAAPLATIDARGGQAAYDALVTAARLALAGRVDAITTAPLHKAALSRAGHDYPGHTELLAELCGVQEFAMMLYLGPGQAVHGPAGLGIAHVTLHMALADVFAALTSDAVLEKARLVHDFMGRLKGSPPKIGVCALNPHGGEEGLFGHEEQSIIRPAVERGLREGLDLSGPFPADTLIGKARDGQYDGLVAMYHDQGHIAIKLLAMHRAVNVTLGLPIVRTSVAHGTAFDVAWQGRAESAGMVQAIRVASQLAGAKR